MAKLTKKEIESIETENFIEAEVKKDLLNGVYDHVLTRCPPEPSGYWHIGHCKAWFIDFETAKKFGGKTNLRMDDTNPTKEDGDFASNYVDELKWLGYMPEKVIYSSEAYFDIMLGLAMKLIEKGKAYVCELSAEEIRNTRGDLQTPGKESPYRNRPIEESMKLFEDMRNGKVEDGKMTLRAKIDMAHPNMNMRDPVIYRVLHATHYKTGDKWCIYPMYDFAHPIEDVLEGITHSLCTIEFEDHRPLYNWFVDNCFENLKYKPRQIEFAALKFENVLIGKRYMKKLVNSKKVLGWDDPRFYTIAGMRKRGITANAIKNFINSAGVTKAVSIIPISALDYYIRDDLNKIATRVMAVFDPLKVVITNYDGVNEEIEVENNPNEEIKTFHKSTFGKEIFIEQEDFSLTPPPKYNRLTLGGYVRLKNAYIIKCNNVVYGKNGEIDHLECEYIKESKSGSDTSGIKVKGTIQFVEKNNAANVVVRQFKNLTKMDILEPSKALENGAELDDILEPNSMIEKNVLAEKYVLSCDEGSRFQFIRKGYYYLVEKNGNKLVFNETVGLKDNFKVGK